MTVSLWFVAWTWFVLLLGIYGELRYGGKEWLRSLISMGTVCAIAYLVLGGAIPLVVTFAAYFLGVFAVLSVGVLGINLRRMS